MRSSTIDDQVPDEEGTVGLRSHIPDRPYRFGRYLQINDLTVDLLT